MKGKIRIDTEITVFPTKGNAEGFLKRDNQKINEIKSESKEMKFPKQSPLKQIRKFCLYCMNGYRKDVLFCRDTNCPFWFLRLGMNPKRAINQNGQRYEEVFKPDNFKKGAKFSPDILTSSLRV